MRRNIEAKARVEDPALLVQRLLSLGARLLYDRHQRDVFFRVPDGYLKLRLEDGGASGAELITYRREARAEPRPSDYEVAKVEQPREVEALLRGRFGVRGIVEKRRRAFRWHHTRIHLDDVEGLGPFLELETVVSGIAEEEAEAEARAVLAALGIEQAALVPHPYVEMLEERTP
jgi:predicted adenylyl cyclase CyaB